MHSPASPSSSPADAAPAASPTPPDASRTAQSWARAWWPVLLVGPDALILYAGFAVGFKARLDAWLVPHATEWGGTIWLILGVYLAALGLSGIYRYAPRAMHLGAFLRVGLALVAAWAASIALTYLVARTHIPPRSVTAIHCLVALVGVLGLRASLRWVQERVAPALPAPPPRPAPLRLTDLVPRDDVQIDATALHGYLADRTVLVTGAGGSIGAELCEQLARLQPFRLVLVDISEYNLYRLEQRLREHPAGSGATAIECCIADVRDTAIMDGLFRQHQPDVVLHAAAYKHVPLMERYPAEAFRNNTLATVGLLRLCERHGAERFVFVSTDKAVAPASVMGATKRLAEWYVRTATSSVERTIVRFGNVFGSQGSVVPFFERRLAEGAPVPVTHPDMERYFMTAHEACSLILQTLRLDAGPVYIFKMGEPVRIDWLAREMVRRRYPEANPDRFIRYVGRRPGEKLHEALEMPGETVQATPHPSILALDGPVPYSRAEVELHLRVLVRLAQRPFTAQARLRKALFAERFEAVDTSDLADEPTPAFDDDVLADLLRGR